MPPRDLGIKLLIVPGLGGSEPDHWQSRWEHNFAHTARVFQDDWDNPHLTAWIEKLVFSVETQPDSLLVAHSLGCALIAHAAARFPHLPIAGALLVAPADIDNAPIVPEHLGSFGSVPLKQLPFPTLTIVSTDDPYITPERARAFSAAWGSALVDVGSCGHINVAAGFGPWPVGETILKNFADQLERRGTWRRFA